MNDREQIELLRSLGGMYVMQGPLGAMNERTFDTTRLVALAEKGLALEYADGMASEFIRSDLGSWRVVWKVKGETEFGDWEGSLYEAIQEAQKVTP